MKIGFLGLLLDRRTFHFHVLNLVSPKFVPYLLRLIIKLMNDSWKHKTTTFSMETGPENSVLRGNRLFYSQKERSRNFPCVCECTRLLPWNLSYDHDVSHLYCGNRWIEFKVLPGIRSKRADARKNRWPLNSFFRYCFKWKLSRFN